MLACSRGVLVDTFGMGVSSHDVTDQENRKTSVKTVDKAPTPVVRFSSPKDKSSGKGINNVVHNYAMNVILYALLYKSYTANNCYLFDRLSQAFPMHLKLIRT